MNQSSKVALVIGVKRPNCEQQDNRKAADDFIKYETAEIQNLIGFCCPYAFVMRIRCIFSSLQLLNFTLKKYFYVTFYFDQQTQGERGRLKKMQNIDIKVTWGSE